MKHPFKITYILLLLFFFSQIIGLAVIAYDAQITQEIDIETNITITHVTYEDTALGPRPEVKNHTSLVYILFAIALVTILLLFIMRFRSGVVFWKLWYFLAVFIAMTVTLGVFLPASLASILALILSSLKLFYKKDLIHNLTEIVVYTGIALLVTPLFSVLWVFILLFAISLYDAYAVWKSKHMIKLAEFTTQTKLFPGFSLHYPFSKHSNNKKLFVKKTSSPKKTTKKSSSDISLKNMDCHF